MAIPETMKAWIKTKPELGGFQLIDSTVPKPQPDEVLVKTHSTSICGTDIHIWKWDDWAADNVPLGTITGHETCGVVVEIGSEVTTHQIGDKIAVECHLACWECDRCDEGNAHICENGEIFGVHTDGAFAPYFTVPAVNARHLPTNLPLELASIQDPLGNAIHTLTGGPVKDSTIAIHGLGPIGLFAVNAAKAMGAKLVIAIDWDNRTRMDLASKLGADVVLGKEDDIVQTILDHTNGQGVDNSCEFSGSPNALKNTITSTRMGGYVNILSVYGNAMTEVPMNEVVFRYLHVKGINGRKMWSTWDKMHELLSEGKIDIDALVTHRIEFREFPDGIKLAMSGDCGKVIMDF
ncbi:MAG: alcohol dehydrogenase catalytic domain-containing protein [Candidatus Thermoplasmatota archaeon]|nr:alcohol dehydrogenase catalytic domain-containing protein [Candidatus Thermoplasmatota archaeon]